MYHAICPPEYNKETIELIETDSRCQIIIATVAFSNGLNATTLLDSLSLEFASTLDESWQEKGRVGRNPDTIGRGVIFAHRSTIKTAENYLACEFYVSVTVYVHYSLSFQLSPLHRTIFQKQAKRRAF